MLYLSLFSGPPAENESQLIYHLDLFSGLRIVIHDQQTKPFYTDGLFLEPGTHNEIKLSKEISETMSYPYSSCQDLTNFNSVLIFKSQYT